MTTPVLLRPPDWTRDAACDGMAGPTADAWDDESPLAPIGRRICATCPVRWDCALEALTNAIPHGIYGGLTPPERRHIARKYGYPTPGAAAHGERSRYVAGCRCNLCRRAHARYEHQRRLRARNGVPPIILDHPEGHGRTRAYPGQCALFTLPKRRSTATTTPKIAA